MKAVKEAKKSIKILRQIADPSGIGKKVNLEFDKEAKIYAGDITKEDYA